MHLRHARTVLAPRFFSSSRPPNPGCLLVPLNHHLQCVPSYITPRSTFCYSSGPVWRIPAVLVLLPWRRGEGSEASLALLSSVFRAPRTTALRPVHISLSRYPSLVRSDSRNRCLSRRDRSWAVCTYTCELCRCYLASKGGTRRRAVNCNAQRDLKKDVQGCSR